MDLEQEKVRVNTELKRYSMNLSNAKEDLERKEEDYQIL